MAATLAWAIMPARKKPRLRMPLLFKRHLGEEFLEARADERRHEY
jgi:hypothetical protein